SLLDESPDPDHAACSSGHTALAKVVAIEDGAVWLEPVQGGSCGACATASACGSKGLGSLASRLEARRFKLAGQPGLQVGDQVELSFPQNRLVLGAAIAYLLPLLFALAFALVADRLLGRDELTALATVAGLFLGFVAMRLPARRLESRGSLQARILRRQEQPIQFFPSVGAKRDA
ncbi:MAG: hypothetical protein RIR00_2152, partial [Pseudomonadota bacterium]